MLKRHGEIIGLISVSDLASDVGIHVSELYDLILKKFKETSYFEMGCQEKRYISTETAERIRNAVADGKLKPKKVSYRRKQRRAVSRVGIAIREGELNRPDTCELCGSQPDNKVIVIPPNGGFRGSRTTRSSIEAHHYNGYDNPLDIWWLCRRCNSVLKGPEWHNGTATKQQAREYINSKK